jgi:lactate dehydrogenase-like 2-hydroxyacid dehydrogenase
MRLSILYPDLQFDDEPTIETAVFGDRADLVIFRESARPAVPDAAWARCDAMVCYHFMAIDAGVVAKLERCRLIVRAGVGFDQIDIAACAARGIPVCNTPDYGTMDVADHAMASILALARGTVTFNNTLAADLRRGWDFLAAPTVRRLSGQVCGIVGLGRIGTATALRAKAFGMDVVFYDPYRPEGAELALGVRRHRSLADLLAESDIVSLHTPLTPETNGLISAAALGRMKRGALLVNTARGPIVDPDAVLAALRSGQLAGAALDVLPTEPPTGGEALLAAWAGGEPGLRERLILSPHSAFYSPSSIRDLRRKSAEVAAAYLFEGRLRNCVNGLEQPGAARR